MSEFVAYVRKGSVAPAPSALMRAYYEHVHDLPGGHMLHVFDSGDRPKPPFVQIDPPSLQGRPYTLGGRSLHPLLAVIRIYGRAGTAFGDISQIYDDLYAHFPPGYPLGRLRVQFRPTIGSPVQDGDLMYYPVLVSCQAIL